MNTMTSKRDDGPWYREPWPWILMAGPFIVVVAAFFSAWLALSTSDGLVADDYYKQGLSVGQTISRNEHAAELGVSTRLRLTSESLTVTVSAASRGEFKTPGAIKITLSHPTRAGLDQSVVLSRQSDGTYAGAFRLPAAGHWLILVEDDAQSWRLMGSVMLPAAGDVVIGGTEAADIRN